MPSLALLRLRLSTSCCDDARDDPESGAERGNGGEGREAPGGRKKEADHLISRSMDGNKRRRTRRRLSLATATDGDGDGTAAAAPPAKRQRCHAVEDLPSPRRGLLRQSVLVVVFLRRAMLLAWGRKADDDDDDDAAVGVSRIGGLVSTRASSHPWLRKCPLLIPPTCSQLSLSCKKKKVTIRFPFWDRIRHPRFGGERQRAFLMDGWIRISATSGP